MIVQSLLVRLQVISTQDCTVEIARDKHYLYVASALPCVLMGCGLCAVCGTWCGLVSMSAGIEEI